MRKKKWAVDRQRKLFERLKQDAREGRELSRIRLNELTIVSLYALRERRDWPVMRLRKLAFEAQYQLRSVLYPEACIDIAFGHRTPSRSGGSSSAERAAQQWADQVGTHLRSHRCSSRDLYPHARIDITLGTPTVPGVDDDGLVAKYALDALAAGVCEGRPEGTVASPLYSVLYPPLVTWRHPRQDADLCEWSASGFPPEVVVRLLLHVVGGAGALMEAEPMGQRRPGRRRTPIHRFIAIAMNLLMLPFPFTYPKAKPVSLQTRYSNRKPSVKVLCRWDLFFALLDGRLLARTLEGLQSDADSHAHTLARCGMYEREWVVWHPLKIDRMTEEQRLFAWFTGGFDPYPTPVAPLLAIARKLIFFEEARELIRRHARPDAAQDWSRPARWMTPPPVQDPESVASLGPEVHQFDGADISDIVKTALRMAPKQGPALGVVADVLHRAGCLKRGDPINTVKASYNRWRKAWVKDPEGEMHELRAWLAARFRTRSGLAD